MSKKISKEKFDTLKMEFVEDFESMKESFFSENTLIQNRNVTAKYQCFRIICFIIKPN